MRYIKSFHIFENKNSPEVISYLEEILDSAKLDGFKVNFSNNDPSLFLRGFARVVGAGKIPDVNINMEKNPGVGYNEIGPYVDHVFSYLIDQKYTICDFSVSTVHQGVTDNEIPYRYPSHLVFVKEGVVKIPNFTDKTFDWVYEYFNTPIMENALVKSVSISFVKS
jgi:hypothetical protein